MPIYKFTSPLFEGPVFFEYENGMLTKFANYSFMESMQLEWLCRNFPLFENMLQAIKGKSGTIEVVQETTDFESFNKFMSKKD